MGETVLHVLDGTTPADLFEGLGRKLACESRAGAAHRIVALGHRSTRALAAAAGITRGEGDIRFVHSMGWADPTGWRGVKREIQELKPSCVHAWGIPGAVAAAQALSGKSAARNGTTARVVSLAELPPKGHLRLLPMIHKGTVTGFGQPAPACTWRVTTGWLKRELHSNGIAADAVNLVRPPLPEPTPLSPAALQAMREDLGLLPGDGPVILLGGEGGAGGFLATPGIDPLAHGARGGPRHDLGMWAAAILQQMFPRIRVIVREDPRGRPDAGFDRLFEHLPDNEIIIPAPARYSWDDLLAISDLLLVTPDGPFAGGCILHAFAAGVAVVGTPVEAVKEYLGDGVLGMLAASTKPRAIAAAIEAFFAGGPELRERLTEEARRKWAAVAK